MTPGSLRQSVAEQYSEATKRLTKPLNRGTNLPLADGKGDRFFDQPNYFLPTAEMTFGSSGNTSETLPPSSIYSCLAVDR